MNENASATMFEVFGQVFYLANRMQHVVDSELRDDGLTAKQFLMIATIEKLFEEPPSLNEIADVLSTSHQNARQLANQLEKKGFLQIVKDRKDRRALRLKLTRKNREYWESRAADNSISVLSLFDSLDDREVITLYYLLGKLMAGVDEMYERQRDGEQENEDSESGGGAAHGVR